MPKFSAKAYGAAVKRYQQAIDSAMALGPQRWYRFFDGSANGRVAMARGEAVWQRQFQPWFQNFLSPPWNTVLEVGYGSGVLLAAAAKHFRAVIGFDIHKHTGYVRKVLHGAGAIEVELHTSSRQLRGIPDGSVDAVYSYLTFMHLYSEAVAAEYLSAIQRVLRPSGVAVIYTARLRCSGTTGEAYITDIEAEEADGTQSEELGYAVLPNRCSLRLGIPWARAQEKRLGMELIGIAVSKRPDGKTYGGQHGFVFRKAEETEA